MNLPNQELLQYLFETYWQDEPGPDEDDLITSHWKHYSGLFRIERQPDGKVISLTGAGFGTVNRGGLFHRLLDQSCIASHLVHLPEKGDILRIKGVATNVSEAMGLHPTLDVFRQVCTLALIKRHLPSEILARRIQFLMIGDGYGVLSALAKSVYPNSTITLVDIGRTLSFQAYYCQRAFPEYSHQLAGSAGDLESADFVYCPAEQLEALEGCSFDVATNVVSMQEMNATAIDRYFGFLRRNLRLNNLFYCCNRESKTLMGGEVSNFSDFPWSVGDRHLIDALCPWHRYYFGRTRPNDGPRLFGVRIALVNYYDGPIRHRLSVLETEAAARRQVG